MGVTTGISAGDRARTIAAAVDPASGPVDLVQPGHVFPLRARPGGIMERAGAPRRRSTSPRAPGCAAPGSSAR